MGACQVAPLISGPAPSPGGGSRPFGSNRMTQGPTPADQHPGLQDAKSRDAAPKTHQNRLPDDFTVCHAGPAQGCAVPNSDAPFGPGFLRRLPEAHCVSA